ncbi:hypothetical protein CCACVL1_13861 [Corchorus capsularis]|uniref:Myb/SANT-like domain-containing protein n=1 Tax=Corchorus capsularis TaxID=210143 RepID=A0A1R3I9F0_COCAP|nr:hypothetical protein CCACVL1_13861 [Corchorus capsularis]
MAAKKSRRWLPDEDAALIAAIVDMQNVGRFNADTGFKGGYLLELERMLHESLPQANIKAKPHIESRIRTLKKEWGIIYDMINGTNTSGFGWDGIREAGKDLSRSIGSEMVIQEKVQELDIILGEIDGLTEEERDIALSKIPDHPAQMLVFGSLPPHRKLAWLRRFLSSH